MKAIRNIGGVLTASAMLFFQLIFVSSCSSQRYSHESLHVNERMENLAEWKKFEDSIRLEWLNVRHLLRLSEESRQVWIWPEGAFSFQLDSGFVGSASALLVEEVERSVQMEEDSVTNPLVRVLAVDSMEERNEKIRELRREVQSEEEMNAVHGTKFWTLIRVGMLLGLLWVGAVWFYRFRWT